MAITTALSGWLELPPSAGVQRTDWIVVGGATTLIVNGREDFSVDLSDDGSTVKQAVVSIDFGNGFVALKVAVPYVRIFASNDGPSTTYIAWRLSG